MTTWPGYQSLDYNLSKLSFDTDYTVPFNFTCFLGQTCYLDIGVVQMTMCTDYSKVDYYYLYLYDSTPGPSNINEKVKGISTNPVNFT